MNESILDFRFWIFDWGCPHPNLLAQSGEGRDPIPSPFRWERVRVRAIIASEGAVSGKCNYFDFTCPIG
jgi:hypothetical protein